MDKAPVKFAKAKEGLNILHFVRLRPIQDRWNLVLALGAGQDTPGKVLIQYLDGIPKFVGILQKKDFDNLLNN